MMGDKLFGNLIGQNIGAILFHRKQLQNIVDWSRRRTTSPFGSSTVSPGLVNRRTSPMRSAEIGSGLRLRRKISALRPTSPRKRIEKQINPASRDDVIGWGKRFQRNTTNGARQANNNG